MTIFWLKLLAAPLLMAVITLAARRYGPRAAGLLAGFPIVSGPVSILLTLERGAPFAARSAVGTMHGQIGVGAFCWTYAACAQRLAWAWSLMAAVLAFAAVSFALDGVVLGPVWTAIVAAGALLVAQTAITPLIARGAATARRSAPAAPPAWDLPFRMAVAATVPLTLTAAAPLLGPSWSGVLATTPFLTATIAAFIQHRDGPVPATLLLHGTAGGTLGSVLFCGIVATMLAPGHVAGVYAFAALAAFAPNLLLARRSPLGTPEPAGEA